MSVARDHADWLSLLEISGPFVSMPVLMRVFPQGLDPRDPEQARQLRLAYEEWQSNPTGPGKQRSWISHVLTQLLRFPADLIAEGQSLPPGLSAAMPEHGETLRPDLALVGPKGTDAAGKPHILVSVYPPDQLLDRPVTGKHWKATAATRMMELLHAADIPLGLVTNGEQWMLVFAPRGETTGFSSWYATLWIEEQVTLRAFHSLLSVNRFFGVAASDTLSALLTESAKDQQEVTNQLGDQVRDAVEVLIQAFDLLDHESGRALLKGVEEKTLYDAALTVMMRLVFLFSAEERDLLHLGRPIYDNNYAVSTLREQLQEVADRYGEEVLERRFDAWSRLLSSFRAVHGGVQHQDLLMPAYGGSLFDPDRYAFLEGRAQETDWSMTAAEPLAINNRVVLHLLKSLQMLQVRVPGGGPAEARRISFRALDIEQIGHIYEGLLDHSAFRAQGTVLGLAGTRKNPTPNITLAELEKLAEQGETKLMEELKELTDRGIPALKKALATDRSEENHKILIACGQDENLANQVTRFAGLLREDSFERPVIILQGGIYISEGTARRSTGTHYTPRSLTEPVVQHTLEPLVYQGPAEGFPKEQWELKSPQEILNLKVCDMTMGSGAFLVQVCRYLSERLVESWENAEKAHPGELLITPEGFFSKGEPSERLIPKDPDERLAIARRLIADRCLYGVDINPMAVEMAKLSIWLITVDKARPFTFLDHALKCGDSLLGIWRIRQLEKFSLDDKHETQVIILSNYDDLIRAAIAKRRELELLPSNDAAQIAVKSSLNEEAEDLVGRLKLASDLLVAAALSEGSEQAKEVARVGAHLLATEYMHKPLRDFSLIAHDKLDSRRTFHWPLEFPEVFDQGGFGAFVGNPPFMGGQRISGNYGTTYRDYLVHSVANSKKGSSDLCAYFYLRAYVLLREEAMFGLLATDTISQGDTREVGLDELIANGGTIVRAIPSTLWPGKASVVIAQLWIHKGGWQGHFYLDETIVPSITAFLTPGDHFTSKPQRLRENVGKCYIGSQLSGEGFKLTEEEATALLTEDSRNADVIMPILRGEDINTNPQQKAVQWVINFHTRSLEKASEYPKCLQLVRERVKPERDKMNRRVRRERWWQFAEKCEALYESISDLDKVFVQPFTSKYVCPSLVSARQVFSAPMIVFTGEAFALFAVLQSSFHYFWVVQFGSKMGATLRYTPSDCFETFPLAQFSTDLEGIGRRYHEHRRETQLARLEGLTSVYNEFHDPNKNSDDIARLRELHGEMDSAVALAYDWTDLDLSHGFRNTKQGVRFTINEVTQHETVRRLLEINHQRYSQEAATTSGSKKEGTSVDGARGSEAKTHGKSMQERLFVSGDSE